MRVMRVEGRLLPICGPRSESARPAPAHSELRVIFHSSPMMVREALGSTKAAMADLSLTDDEASTVELVLAEAMNNVVEHAYPDEADGVIELRISLRPGGLDCTILDDGLPMPPEGPPKGRVQAFGAELADLPEGGFGWMIIREFARDLRHERIADRNRFAFRLPLDSAARAH